MFKWLEKYFTFTRSERNAVVTLIFLCFAVLLVPRIYLWCRPVHHANIINYKQEILLNPTDTSENDSVSVIATGVHSIPDSVITVRKRYEAGKYFDFDPNKIGINEWIKLGFTEKQAQVIENYKAKGGKFYRPENLMRLYVMTAEHYNQLLPYVKIDTGALPKRNYKKY